MLNQQSAKEVLNPQVIESASESMHVVICCFREEETELRHSLSSLSGLPSHSPSIRLMVYVDGLQDMLFMKEAMLTGKPKIPWDSEDAQLATLQALRRILQPEQVRIAHGCLQLVGVTDGGIPFEVSVKGPDIPRSKRCSHAECLSRLAEHEKLGGTLPQALLFLDGDTRIEPSALTCLYACLMEQRLGAVTCSLFPAEVGTTTLLWTLAKYWGISGILWAAQSSVRFQHPAPGAAVMYSTVALQSVKEDYCRMARPESIWDSIRLEMGEDSYLGNLLLASGHGVRFMPHCHATSFLPATWLEYLAQQSRWKRSHLGNRSDILFCKWRTWRGPQALLWPLEVFELLTRGEQLGVCTATVVFAKVLGHPAHHLHDWLLSIDSSLSDIAVGVWYTRTLASLTIFLLVWVALGVYASLAAGVPVAQQPILHNTAMALSAAAMALQFAVAIGFWQVYKVGFFWVLLLSVPCCTYLIRMPHGLPRPWGGAVLPLLGGLSAGIENILAPVLGIANLDGTNGNWGTRQLKVDIDQGAANEIISRRRLERIRLATLWFTVNCSCGALLLWSSWTGFALHVLLGLTCVHLLGHLFMALGYSLWLKICAPGYDGILSEPVSSDSGL